MKQKRNTKQKDILFIFISSFIVVVAWICFNIYHIWVTSTVSEDLQLQLTPIAPVFDAQTMNQLRTRENINPIFATLASPSALPTPVKPIVTPTVALSASQTPTPTVQPSATPSLVSSPTPQVTSPINRVGQ